MTKEDKEFEERLKNRTKYTSILIRCGTIGTYFNEWIIIIIMMIEN